MFIRNVIVQTLEAVFLKLAYESSEGEHEESKSDLTAKVNVCRKLLIVVFNNCLVNMYNYTV